MTKRQIEKRLATLGLRLVRGWRNNGNRWIVYADSHGMAREVTTLRSLADVAELVCERGER